MATCTKPIEITDARLVSSSVSEPSVGEAAWSSGTTYAEGDLAILGALTSTVTMTIAAPGVVTWNSHGLPNGAPVIFTTTGALPTGLTAGTTYYVVKRTANTFSVSQTADGRPITTTGSQSGTHTAKSPVHRIFESQIGSNTGNPPLMDSTKWVDVGPTNAWACFDLYRGTKTWGASPMTIVLSPGVRVNSIFLGGLVANSATITVKSGGVTKKTINVDLSTRITTGWYRYFFGAFSNKPSTLRQDLPPYTDAEITVELTRSSGDVGIGDLVLGNFTYLGKTQYGATAGSRNFTKIERGLDGSISSIQRRANLPTSDQTIWFEKSATTELLRLRDETSALPCVWSGLDDPAHDYFEAVTIKGIATRFDINLEHPDHGVLTTAFEEA